MEICVEGAKVRLGGAMPDASLGSASCGVFVSHKWDNRGIATQMRFLLVSYYTCKTRKATFRLSWDTQAWSLTDRVISRSVEGKPRARTWSTVVADICNSCTSTRFKRIYLNWAVSNSTRVIAVLSVNKIIYVRDASFTRYIVPRNTLQRSEK